MLQIWHWTIMRTDAVSGVVPSDNDAPQTERRRVLAERQLMQAAISADALYHALRQRGVLTADEQYVCDELVQAIGEGLKLGF